VFRRDRYEIGAGDAASYTGSGAQGFSGFRPQNAGASSRRSGALYLNLETDFSKRASAAFALRREHYSDFGNATSAKLSGRFVAAEGVAFRATASTGFRAPSLAQQHYTITTTNFIVVNGVNQPLETGTFPVGSAAAQSLGATPLKAEKSRNYSLGVLLQPAKNLTATIDLYQIDVDHRILFSGNLVLPTALQSQLAATGVLASAARYFTNAVDTRTRGVDVVTTYRVDWQRAGRTDLSLGYNHNRNSVRSVAANPAVLTQNNLTLIDAQTLGRATVAAPESKLALGADHSVGRWAVRTTATRYGSFVVPQNTAALNQTYGAAWVLDLSGSVKVDRWTFTAGADNLTNRYPDPTTSAGNLNTNGIFRYSNFSPFGFNGRFYYAKANYAW
jgi:iron complex outermembrane receptor protein